MMMQREFPSPFAQVARRVGADALAQRPVGHAANNRLDGDDVHLFARRIL